MAVTVEAFGPVRLVKIGSPPHGILTASGTKELLAAMDAVFSDMSVRAIVVAGSDPGIFVRHYDLGSIRKAADALRAGIIEPSSFIDADFARLTDTIASSQIPVIAAINGTCMGGGFELALACDVRIAGRSVRHIGLPEMRVDILPGGGGTIRLARLIGESAALDMALRGRTVDAQRAWELGIVGDVADDAVSAALGVAEAMAHRDPRALSAIKRLVRSAHDGSCNDRLAGERLAFAAHLIASDQALASMDQLLASGFMLEDVPGCEVSVSTAAATSGNKI